MDKIKRLKELVKSEDYNLVEFIGKGDTISKLAYLVKKKRYISME